MAGASGTRPVGIGNPIPTGSYQLGYATVDDDGSLGQDADRNLWRRWGTLPGQPRIPNAPGRMAVASATR
jgi:hypothetical protein